MQQNSTSNQQGSNAHLGFSHPHYPHHHLFMRPGLVGSIGDVFSCVKCEKMFSTAHGLEVKIFMMNNTFCKFHFIRFSIINCNLFHRYMQDALTMVNAHSHANCAIRLLDMKLV